MITREVQAVSPHTVDGLVDPSAEYSPPAAGLGEKPAEPTPGQDHVNNASDLILNTEGDSLPALPQSGLL